jgi:ATP-binding cassette, subfamily B, bacterial
VQVALTGAYAAPVVARRAGGRPYRARMTAGVRRGRQGGLSRRIVREVRPHWTLVASAFGAEVLATPLLLLNPVPLKIVVDSVIGDRPMSGFLGALMPASWLHTRGAVLAFAAVLQVAIVLLVALQEMAAYVLQVKAGERMTLALRAKLFRHVQRLSVLFHDSRGTTDSIYRVQYDATALQNLTTEGILPFLTATFTLVVTLMVIARLDWQLAVVALAVMPPLYGLARFYSRRMRPRYTAVMQVESSAMGVVQEALTSLRIVKLFGHEGREDERFVDTAGQGAAARVRLATAEGKFGLWVNATTGVGTALVLVVGGINVQSGALTLGQLMMVVFYLTQLYSPLSTISKQASSIQSELASAERTFELLDETPDVGEAADPVPLGRAQGAIEFRNVTFSYDPEQPVLHDVTFAVPAGTRVGIAGRTGAGKTTLIGLLTRFFDPTAGHVVLDGIDVRRYAVADVRRQFAVVPQDSVLFSTTIAENIAYGRPGASSADIVAAAQAADADEFIIALPNRYETLVGERGMRLSGGERQRIALARAFLKDAPVLLLDEPTSSVDVHTEASIIDAMRRLMVGRTVFMIAHRLGTLDMCDLRLELAHGRLVEHGRQSPVIRSPAWESGRGATEVGAGGRQRPRPWPGRGD